MDLLKNKGVINNTHIFYRALVEDRDDPDKLNRCRVRIFGMHSDDDSKVASNTLPWAEMAAPVLYGGQNAGIGISTVPLKGTWVWVFFDGGDWNRPIIFGTMYGIPTMNTSEKLGFLDPDGEHPLTERLDEEDTNRLANQNKFDETPIKLIKDTNRDLATGTSTGEQWDELEQMTSAAAYPDNHVIETITGNFVEFDDTEGNSRMHWFHKSGTYWEVVEDGDYSMKVVRDHYEIIDRDVKRLVKRDETHTVQRNQEYKIDGWQEILIDGFSHEVINGYVFQEYQDYFHNITQKYVREEYHSYQHTTVDDYVLEEYKNYQKTTVDDYVEEIYNSTQETTVTDSVTETYNSTFDTTVMDAVTQTYNATFDITVIDNTTCTYSADYDETVIGAATVTINSTYDITAVGASTETFAATYDKTAVGASTETFSATYDKTVIGPATNTFSATLSDTVVGPFSATYTAGATITGGAPIVMQAPIILLN